MSGIDGLYADLALAPGATPDEIKRAFRKIARECHPDVSGGDASKEARFQRARDAYETLSDPDKRAAAEAASRPPPPPRAKQGRAVDEQGAFFHAFYRRAAGKSPEPAAKTHSETFRARAATPPPQGADKLDDLFADFGFGASRGGPRPSPGGAPGAPRRGDDVILDLEVPGDVARDGGRVKARYARLGRSPSWTPSNASPGIEPRQEEVELEVPPETRHASVRRYSGLGDCGPYGGPAGDLVVRMRVLDDPTDRAPGRAAPPPRDAERSREPGAESTSPERIVVDVSVWEALLGGRVEVDTPSGRVKMSFPPCTAPGRSFRLRGRGAPERGGAPGDVVVELRVVMPERLDDEARRLVEQLAALHPEAPR
jgi:DnaJ-class molecular chaperone